MSNTNRKRQRDGEKVDYLGKQLEMIKSRPPQTVFHFPSDLEFPQYLTDTFPQEQYRSRKFDVKTCVHWGQRKLLLSEIQLLTKYCEPGVSYHIVYAGSAPGTHLAFLDDMFNSRHTWELVDPGQFDTAVLGDRKNFSLRNEFFTNSTAYGINARRVREFHPYLGALYAHLTSSAKEHAKKELHEKLKDSIGTIDVARGTTDIPSMYEIPLSLPRGFNLLCEVAQERCKPLLFVSDIRSGSLDLPNFEEHVQENMKAQECWTQLLNGKYSMLKFRLPYTWVSVAGESKPVRNTTTIREDGTVPYLRGEILLPIWTRPTSTEGRLVVPQDAFQVPYNVEKVEDQFFYFNSRMREQFHFNHVVRNNDYLDHHYDATAEVRCLQEYLRFTRPELKGASDEVISSEVIKISNRITACLKVSFEDAIRRRDALVLRQAAQNAPKNTDTHGKTTLADVVRALVAQGTVERERAVWKENMDETQAYDSPKEWVKS